MKLEGFKTIRDQNSTEGIVHGMSVFSADVVENKYPNAIDGLKTIHRRAFWYGKDHTKLTNMQSMIGGIMQYHTSGDSSVFEVLIANAQPFNVEVPLIQVEGKVGEYYDPDGAAAPRYLSACLSEFAYDIFFKGINLSAIPMKDNKEFNATFREPSYLIPKIPVALMLGHITVGYGFKSIAPSMSLASVCDLVMKYAEDKIKGDASLEPDPKVYGKMLVPAWPMRNLITNRKELINSYSHGDFETPICQEGVVEISGDQIVVRSVRSDTKFSKAVADLRDMLKDSKCPLYDYINTANSYSADEANLTIPLKAVANRNPFFVLDILRPILKLTGKIYPSYIYANDGKLVKMTPLKVLATWYRFRYASISAHLKQEQARLITVHRELEAKLLYIDNQETMTEIVKKSDTLDDIIVNVHNAFKGIKLSKLQAKVISEVQLKFLAKYGRRTILADMEQNEQQQKENAAKFGKINQIIYNDALNIKKAYAPKHTPTRYSDDFKGYVQYGNLGVINFFDDDDMRQLLLSRGWRTDLVKSIHLYDSKYPNKFIVKNNRLRPLETFSREICCEDLICYPNNRNTFLTLAVNTKTGATCIVENNVEGIFKEYKVFPITKQFYAIHRDGRVTNDNYQNYSIRKSVSTGAKTDVIYALPEHSSDLVVFHMNSADPNIVRIDRILTAKSLGRLVTVPNGHMYILGVHSLKSKEIYLNIPKECTKSVVIDHLIVRNISELFKDDKNNQLLDLNKSSKLSKKLKRDKLVKPLYTLDLGDNEDE